MSHQLKLSILDLATIYNGESASETLHNSAELAQLADRLGYTRYWFAKHHNTEFQMSTSPDLLGAHVAAVTQDIRIGSGGIMLPNHSPLKVAENFSQEHPFKSIRPSAEQLIPDIYMLGSSDGGMRFASENGLGFVFAAHIAPHLAIQMLNAYRGHFKPSYFLQEPKSALAIIVIAAETEEEAAYLAAPAELQWVRWGTGQFTHAPPTLEEAVNHVYTSQEEQVRQENRDRFVIGSVDNVKKKLEEIAEQAKVDEIMILNMLTEKKTRHRSYELLADAFGLN